MRLAGRVALVTGAGQGLGRAIALRLAADGARVAALDIRAESAAATAEAIAAAGGSAMPLTADVSAREEVRHALAELGRTLGPPSILVNNAGVARLLPFLETTPADWDLTLAVNLTGAFVVSQEVARGMVAAGGGRIVNVTSVTARLASADLAAYAASKAGLEGLTRAMAFELGPHGIGVNAVAAGTILTEPTRRLALEDFRARVDRSPLDRLAEPDEIAAAVAFLASADASYVHGSVLAVDGGAGAVNVRRGTVA